jgi:hypothetical protein
LERLPATNLVTAITAHAVLCQYARGLAECSAFGDPLAEHQIATLLTGREAGESEAEPRAEDEPLLRVLREDGRASYAQLAAASGLSPGASRRLNWSGSARRFRCCRRQRSRRR